MIPVTKPFMPPQEEYVSLLNGIWEREWLTNMGPLAKQLEYQLKDFLNIGRLLFVTNGTVALQMALKALNITGEVITTPFSFVATTSSIVWEGCTPIFVDINPETLNIDPAKIEASITPNTQAILATHVYGNPCDVDAIDVIAKKYNLKVIYDGAHAFGVMINGRSIFEYGDISTCSLHATKLYHSVEGGLIICNSEEIHQELGRMRNFGISGFDTFSHLGINGKNSEFHAAMGLVNLTYFEKIKAKRLQLVALYDQLLKNCNLTRPVWHQASQNNGAYYAVVFESEEILLECKEVLAREEIGTRRYFYPSLSSALPYLKSIPMPVTDDISKRVLCLPMYYELSLEQVAKICSLILSVQPNNI